MASRPVAVILQVLAVMTIAAAVGHGVTGTAPRPIDLSGVAGSSSVPAGTSAAGISYAQHPHRVFWLKVDGRWRMVPS